MNIPRYDETMAIVFKHGIDDGWRGKPMLPPERFGRSPNDTLEPFDVYSHGYDVGRWLSSCYRKK
jgi:hypothetical protein